MRLSIVSASALIAISVLAAAPGARACTSTECGPPLAAFPVYTHEGLLVGTVAAPVRVPAPLQRSRVTGQPLTVVFNNPGRFPGSIDPTMRLMRLPHVARFKTQGVYPRAR